MFYTNINRNFIVNADITEWDIHSANISLIKTFKLLSEDKIHKIEDLNKKDRVIKVGLEMQKDKNFSKQLESHFNDVIKEFIESNNLDQDYDITSIKRDAAFVVNRKITKHQFGKYIDFLPKNHYHAYLYIKPYEFYFGKNNNIDIKGLRDEIYSLHQNGILTLLNDIVLIAEESNMNTKKINRYLSDYTKAYKNRELDFDMYREFTNESKFKYIMMGNEMLLDNIDDELIEKIDISHNYLNIIMPLIQLLC